MNSYVMWLLSQFKKFNKNNNVETEENSRIGFQKCPVLHIPIKY